MPKKYGLFGLKKQSMAHSVEVSARTCSGSASEIDSEFFSRRQTPKMYEPNTPSLEKLL